MDTSNFEKIIAEQFHKLPKGLQQAILDKEFRKKITEIARVTNLLDDQLSKLEEEIMLVLLGIKHPAEWAITLEETLGLDEKRTITLIQETERLIFTPIKSSLDQMYGSLESKPAEKILEETLNAAPKLQPRVEPPPAKSAEKILEESMRPSKTAPPPANLPTGDFSVFAKPEKAPVPVATVSQIPPVQPKPVAPTPVVPPTPKTETPVPLKEKPVVWETSFTKPKPTLKPEEMPISPVLPLSKKGAWDFPEENPEGLSKDDILNSIENPREKSDEKMVKTGTVVPPIKAGGSEISSSLNSQFSIHNSTPPIPVPLTPSPLNSELLIHNSSPVPLPPPPPAPPKIAPKPVVTPPKIVISQPKRNADPYRESI